jgi:hypothetical protein
MPDYYFDIETHPTTQGPNFENDMIISITYQHIDSRTGEPKDQLKILKSWESSEKDILQQFYPILSIEDKWGFIPIGCNLSFDFTSLIYRYRKIGREIKAWKLFTTRPSIDIQPILVLFNKGSFKGSGLDNFTKKKYPGSKVIEWYNAKDYNAIEDYIKNEAESFIDLYKFLVKRLPLTWLEFAQEQGIIKS